MKTHNHRCALWAFYACLASLACSVVTHENINEAGIWAIMWTLVGWFRESAQYWKEQADL